MLYNKISLVINGLHSRFLTDIESPLDSRYNKVSLRIQHKLVPETNFTISSIFEFQRKEAKFELNFFLFTLQKSTTYTFHSDKHRAQ